MITPAIALLLSALSALTGAALAALLMRSLTTRHAAPGEENQEQDRATVLLHKQADALTRKVKALEEERRGLTTLLGLPTEVKGFERVYLGEAFAEIMAMKHVTACVAISTHGFLLYGDERSPESRSLAALSGIFSGQGLWPQLDGVSMLDTLGQRLTLRRIVDETRQTQCIVGIWSSGATIPRSALARMEASLGNAPHLTHTRPSKLANIKEEEMIPHDALARLVRDASVVSVLISTDREEVLCAQGTRVMTWPGAQLIRMCERFFSARQAQGCGELEQLVLSHGALVTMMQTKYLPDGTHMIVEAQLALKERVPEEALRHATTQFGWHIQSRIAPPSKEATQPPPAKTMQHASHGAS